MSIEPFLNYVSRHVTLTDDDISILEKYVSIRRYLKGQYVVQQGDICRYESFIISGCTRTFHVDKVGNEHSVMFSIEDWWAADMGSFITQTPADFNVQCIEDTIVAQFSFDIIETLYEKIPKLERLLRIIVEKAFVASQKRIIRNFSMTAKERYLYFHEKYPEIENRIPQYYLASYLGITKEFLSKIKGELAKSS